MQTPLSMSEIACFLDVVDMASHTHMVDVLSTIASAATSSRHTSSTVSCPRSSRRGLLASRRPRRSKVTTGQRAHGFYTFAASSLDDESLSLFSSTSQLQVAECGDVVAKVRQARVRRAPDVALQEPVESDDGLLGKSVDDRLYHHHPPRRMIGCQMGWGKERERGESTKSARVWDQLADWTMHGCPALDLLTCSRPTATSAPFDWASRVPRPELRRLTVRGGAAMAHVRRAYWERDSRSSECKLRMANGLVVVKVQWVD